MKLTNITKDSSKLSQQLRLPLRKRGGINFTVVLNPGDSIFLEEKLFYYVFTFISYNYRNTHPSRICLVAEILGARRECFNRACEAEAYFAS